MNMLCQLLNWSKISGFCYSVIHVYILDYQSNIQETPITRCVLVYSLIPGDSSVLFSFFHPRWHPSHRISWSNMVWNWTQLRNWGIITIINPGHSPKLGRSCLVQQNTWNFGTIERSPERMWWLWKEPLEMHGGSLPAGIIPLESQQRLDSGLSLVQSTLGGLQLPLDDIQFLFEALIEPLQRAYPMWVLLSVLREDRLQMLKIVLEVTDTYGQCDL